MNSLEAMSKLQKLHSRIAAQNQPIDTNWKMPYIKQTYKKRNLEENSSKTLQKPEFEEMLENLLLLEVTFSKPY